MTRPAARLALAAALSAGLSACAGDTNPVRDAFVGVGAGAAVPKRPDFVEASRPASTEYMPVGVSAPARPSVKRTPEQVKALEAELDGTRARHQTSAEEARRLATTPAPEPVRVAPITDAPAARR